MINENIFLQEFELRVRKLIAPFQSDIYENIVKEIIKEIKEKY